MLKAVFIDIDNTLLSFDGYVRQTMRDGFRKFGICEYSEDMFVTFTAINNGLWRRIEEGTLTFEGLMKIRWNTIFNSLGISFDGEAFEKYFRSCIYDSAIPMENAYTLLEYLKGKYILCAASNGPYEQQVHRLEVGKMKDYFDYFFISEDIGYQKPSGLFFDECFRRLNTGRSEIITPPETLIIGDSLSSDMRGGIDYGMKTCFYNFASIPLPEDMRPDFCVTTLKEIRSFT